MHISLNNIDMFCLHIFVVPFDWNSRIHRQYLCKGIRPPCESPGYDTKSDGEVSAMLEHWGMQSTPSLALLPGPLWPGMVAPNRTLSIGSIELTV